MAINITEYNKIVNETKEKNSTLVAVSKLQPVSAIESLYQMGQRDFGENYVQELITKQPLLPGDIQWHFIGHLQSNKVKYIAPFVHLVHTVDSEKLLNEINKQAAKNNRVIHCLIQVHIAEEDTKFGLLPQQAEELLLSLQQMAFKNIVIAGLMGMASFSDDVNKVAGEFKTLQQLFKKYQQYFSKNQTPHIAFNILSMGMSGDYTLAMQHGSNMIRVGSLIFGQRH
ncbi:MAG: YggS family pyridoxal phosphate-dependent enzyme [Niastella sp.]|nr:YggS family pyridoxal phosphate-dependent enzyme [Niastella sp.]